MSYPTPMRSPKVDERADDPFQLADAELSLKFCAFPGVLTALEPMREGRSGMIALIDAGNVIGHVCVEGPQPLTLSRLAEFLIYDPRREDMPCLLERLLSRSHQLVIIAVPGWCEDQVRPYEAPQDWHGSIDLPGPVASHEAAELISAMKLACSRLRRSGDESATGCESLVEALDSAEACEAFGRLIVVTGATPLRLDGQEGFEAYKNRLLSFDRRLGSLVKLMVLAIEEARNGTGDAVAMVRQIVDSAGAIYDAGMAFRINNPEDETVWPGWLDRALRYFTLTPEDMSPTALERFLSCNDDQVRGLAAEAWFKDPHRSGDDELWARWFEDADDWLAVGALCGVRSGWTRYGEERRAKMLERLAQLAAKPAVADTFMLEAHVYVQDCIRDGRKPDMSVFGRLLPTIIEGLPADTSNQAFDLFLYKDNDLGPQAVADACEAWIARIEQDSHASQSVSMWSRPLAEMIVERADVTPELRQAIFSRLLRVSTTQVVETSFECFVRRWTQLRSPEKERLLELLGRCEGSANPMKVVALTQQEVAPEIQTVVLGRADALAAAPRELIHELPLDLLEAGMVAHVSTPSWGATGKGPNSAWQGIVEKLARTPDHPLFGTAFGGVFLHGTDDQIAREIRVMDPDLFDLTFRTLVHNAANSRDLPESWAALFARVPDPVKRAEWKYWAAQWAPEVFA